MESLLHAKMAIRKVGRKKRKNASVNGWTVCMDHLKIGAAPPQIMLAIMSASIASFALDIDSFVILVSPERTHPESFADPGLARMT